MVTTKRKVGFGGGHSTAASAVIRPTAAQLAWLKRGLREPGGKLPLFDGSGQRINPRTIRSCISQGWAQPWFQNPIKPDWLVCKLTEEGRRVSDDT